jgi:amino acid transporter
MRYAWKAQGRDIADLPWKSWTFPYAAWWGLSWCIILIFVEFYLSVWPLGESPSAKTFFANYISVPLMLVLYFGARFYYRGPWWVDASKIDLDGTRRFYVDLNVEKATKGGVVGGLSKAVGFVLN